MPTDRPMPHRRFVAVIGLAVVLATPAAAQSPTVGGARVGIANPASVACVEAGGRLEIRDGTGGQTGWCHLPDGRICEEWALFRDKRCVTPPGAPIPAPPPKP